MSLNFGMLLETLMKLRVTEPDFFEKSFLLQKSGKWARNMSKMGFFEFKEKFDVILYKSYIWEKSCS